MTATTHRHFCLPPRIRWLQLSKADITLSRFDSGQTEVYLIGVQSPARTLFRADTDSCTRTCVSGVHLRLCDDGGTGASRVSHRAGNSLPPSAWPGTRRSLEVCPQKCWRAQSQGL